MVWICSWVERWNTHNECLWVQWCEYVHELKDGMFYSTRRSRVEWNIPAFNEWTYSHHCTNEKHSLFVLYNIQVDLCHFDWKIQLSKQTKRRPTLFNCKSRMLVMLLIMPCSNTAALPNTRARNDVFTQLFSFHPKSTIARWQRAMVLFGWNEKARWVTQRAMVLLFAITWRTILQSNGKDLLGCYINSANTHRCKGQPHLM